MRIKKKIESNINELEIALDHANKANAEAAKQVFNLFLLTLQLVECMTDTEVHSSSLFC